MTKTKKPKLPKRRNPIAKAVKQIKPKVKPDKKKNARNYTYNNSYLSGND